MISSTSKPNRKRLYVYIGVTLFVGLFSAVYEYFSHGVYSGFMIFAFAVPLIFGVLPELLARKWPGVRGGEWARLTRDFGVATLTVGMILQGIVEIYGTTNGYIPYFFVSGGLMIISGFIIQYFRK